MAQRKSHTTKFKKRVALDAIKDQLTVAELARKHQVRPSQIKAWRKILIEQSDGLFEHKTSAAQLLQLKTKTAMNYYASSARCKSRMSS